MKVKKRSFIQILITSIVITNCIIYFLYINDFISFKLLSIGDLNPYGGWSELKSSFIDVTYRWRGISKQVALTIAIGSTALLMGRFFCGFICPIGSLQDFFKYIGNKFGIKEIELPRGRLLNVEAIKYLVFIILLILSILGLGSFIAPYSPWTSYLNVFMGFNIQIGFLVLILIILSSLFIKRVFCRCFCPLGAFQSLLYAIGPLKIHANKECGSCSHCLDSCPVDIKETHDVLISPECINCLECTEKICVKGTGGYSLKFAGRKLNKNLYISISMVLSLIIYIFISLIGSRVTTESIEDLGIMEDGIYIGMGTGFGGNIRVQVSIDGNRITRIETIEHSETSGYYQEVYKSISKELIDSQSLNVDAISGATATSRGFLNAVKSGLSQSLKN